jgi:hypothetical protein
MRQKYREEEEGRDGYAAFNKPLIPAHYYVFGLVMFITYACCKVASPFSLFFFIRQPCVWVEMTSFDNHNLAPLVV